MIGTPEHGAWECEHRKPIFDDNQNEHDIPNSPELTVRTDLVNNKTSTIPSATPESAQEIIRRWRDT